MGEAWELESASAVSEATGGATHIITTPYRGIIAGTTGQAARPITTISSVFGSLNLASKLIRLRSTSLSSRKVSLAISTASWVRQ